MMNLLGLVLLLTGIQLAGAAPVTADADTERELKALRGELFDAQRRGDRATLERVLAVGFTFSHSTGRVEERDDYISRMVAAAASAANAGPPAEIEFIEDRIRVYDGHTAVWTTRSVRHGGPAGRLEFRSTDVLVKSGGRWRWVSVHSTRLRD